MPRLTSTLRAALAASGIIALAPAAQAGAICSAGDLSLTIGGRTYAPSACANGIDNGNPALETARLNAAFGTDLAYLDKTDDAGPASPFGGLSFTIAAPGTPRGTWTLGWSGGAAGLAATVDLVIGVFAASQGLGYRFEDVLLPDGAGSGSGGFTVAIANRRGNAQDLSHMTLLGGDVELLRQGGAAAFAAIPEPAALALVVIGLLGLGLVSLRRHV